MNENTVTDPQINIVNFVSYLKRRWKSTLVISLVFALFLGGCYIIKKSINGRSSESYDEKLNQYEADLSVYEENKVAFIYAVEIKKSDLETMEKYMEESVLMALDAENLLVTKTDVVFTKEQVETESGKELAYEDIAAVYYDLLTDNANWKEVGDFIKRDEDVAKELVEVSIPLTGVVRIKVLYPDKGYAKAITEILLNGAQDKIDEFDMSYKYNYLILSQSSKTERDTGLRDAIKEKKDKYEAMKRDYKESVENVNNYKAPECPKKGSGINENIIVKGTMFSIVGFVVGFLIVVFVRANSFINTGIIFSEDEFSRISGYRNLCVFDRAKKKSPKGVYESFANSDKDKAYERVKIYFDNEEKDVSKIMLIDMDAQRGNQIISVLKKKIEDKDFALCSDINGNDALKTLFDSDGVIVVCEREKTTAYDISEIKKFVDDNGSKIMGNIII